METKSSKKAYQKIKNISSILFIIVLIFQVFVIGYITQTNNSIDNNILEIEQLKTNNDNIFIKDTIRQQQRQTLNAVRQSWLQYLTTNNIDIVLKKNGNYVFEDKNGNTITFNTETMKKIKTNNSNYSIVDKITGEVILNDCRPAWNMENIEHILNIIATPIKAFGEKSEILVYDVYTGEVIIDNSSNSNSYPEILDEKGYKNILFYINHPENKNPKQYELVIKELLNKSDTQRISEITSLFYEPNIKEYNSVNDFSKYPFGNYNREFIEKIILPYESIGVEGLDMQLGIAIRSQEQEIYSSYKDNDKEYSTTINKLKHDKSVIFIFPMISTLLSLIVILVALYSVRASAYYCKHAYKK